METSATETPSEVHAQGTRMPFEQRKEVLAEEISRQLARGNRRLESQSDLSAVIVIGKPVNHVLHAILTFMTAGLWLIVWAFLYNFRGEKREMISISESGTVTIRPLKS